MLLNRWPPAQEICNNWHPCHLLHSGPLIHSMPDYASFYAILGVTSETDWKTLRARYKRLIGQWHPDRFSADPTDREIAEERSKQITIAYQALDRYRRDHGELPPAAPAEPAGDEKTSTRDADARFDRASFTAHAKAASTDAGAAELAKRKPRRGHRAGIALAAVIGVVYFGYHFIEAWAPGDAIEHVDEPDVAPQPPPVAENPRESDSISNGSTFGEVYTIQGVPTLTQGDTWYYGKSKIHFSQGRVISWDEHLDNPLRIDHHYAVHSDDRYFRIGSTKDEVRAIQGAPVVETDAVWYYAPSRVYFRNDRVVRWENSPAQPLKVPR